MPSEQLFTGSWIVEVYKKDADFSERFIISGSQSSDGIYPGEVTTPPILVAGTRWFLRFEWNDKAGSGWQPSDLRRTAASYSLQDGLVTFLGADDNTDGFRDHDFNDLILRCRNRDPHINPRIPLTAPPNFTLPSSIRNKCQQNNERCHDHEIICCYFSDYNKDYRHGHDKR